MARKRQLEHSGHAILVIDDQPDCLASTRRVLEREGHEVVAVDSARAGLLAITRRRFDLVLVDYFMPGMTGEEFVLELRRAEPTLQVLLQTGYASEQPPRSLLKRLDIQGYHDKSEGPEKLCLWVDVALRAARAARIEERSRRGLEYILDATPELQRMQPLDDLLQGVLLQMSGLLGAVDTFVAIHPDARAAGLDSCLILADEEGELETRAATGRFSVGVRVREDHGPNSCVHDAIRSRMTVAGAAGTGVPLLLGDSVLGAIFVDRALHDSAERRLLQVFASQAAVAIRNATLYEMAALDPLTGAHARRFFEMALAREVRMAHRSGSPLGLVIADMDRLKHINDTWGHRTGDRAIAAVGAMLRGVTRAGDVVGRIGGDELAVVLPGADEEGVLIVLERISSACAALTVREQGALLPVRTSAGGAVLSPADARLRPSKDTISATMEALLRAADAAQYASKRGAPIGVSRVDWASPRSSAPPVAPERTAVPA